MTAVPRDPAFWRRFSMAIHQQEALDHPHSQPLNRDYSSSIPGPEAPKNAPSEASSIANTDLEKQQVRSPKPVQEEGWLQHERAKQRRSKICLPVFMGSVVALIVVVVLVLVWLSNHNWFINGGPVTIP